MTILCDAVSIWRFYHAFSMHAHPRFNRPLTLNSVWCISDDRLPILFGVTELRLPRRIFVKLAFVLSVSFTLAACETFFTVEGVSVIASDKTATDHVVSLFSGKDCSVVRTERGLSYCVEDEVRIESRVFCYQTLGSVSCYDRPDPRRSPDELMGQNEHNLGN